MIYYKLFRKDKSYLSAKCEYHQLRLDLNHEHLALFEISLYRCDNPEKEDY